MLSRPFRRLFLEGLTAASQAGELRFFTDLRRSERCKGICGRTGAVAKRQMGRLREKDVSGPGRLLAYLARYTHRVAITNSCLLNLDYSHVTFRSKAYRQGGGYKNKVTRIAIAEFMRRFLLHVLPNGFHRIRHYGFLASGHRADRLALCRSLLTTPSEPVVRKKEDDRSAIRTNQQIPPCPCCGGYMAVVETLQPTPAISCVR